MHWLFFRKIKVLHLLAFQKILVDSNRKPNKIWVDKGIEFYHRLIESWLQDNDIEKYSTDNEDKSDVYERFIRTLKNKIYKYMSLIPKFVYINRLSEIVNEHNNTYGTIKKSQLM